MAIFRCALLETGVVEFPINISVFERRIILNEIPRRLSLFISCIGVSTSIKQKLYPFSSSNNMEGRLSIFYPYIGISTLR